MLWPKGLAKTTVSPLGLTSLRVRLFFFYAKIRSAATIFLERLAFPPASSLYFVFSTTIIIFTYVWSVFGHRKDSEEEAAGTRTTFTFFCFYYTL